MPQQKEKLKNSYINLFSCGFFFRLNTQFKVHENMLRKVKQDDVTTLHQSYILVFMLIDMSTLK